LQLLLPLLLPALPPLLPLQTMLSASVCPLPEQTTVLLAQAPHVQAHPQLITKATHGHWFLPVLAKQWNCQQLLMAWPAWVHWKR
jgi:hypothetical protein